MKILLVSLFFITNVLAHKLNLFYVNENDKIYFSSYFASGAPCQNCAVKIYDKNKTLLKEFKTDKKGEFFIENLNDFFLKVETIGGHAVEEKVYVDKKITNDNPQEIIEKKSKATKINSIINSIIAIIAIFLIFYLLKRYRKSDRV